MSETCKTVNINGQEYVRSDLVPATPLGDKPFVIIRSFAAGVFAGYLVSRTVEGGVVSVILDRAIRLHRWTGCSLSQVANDGIAGTGENRFSMETNNHRVENAIEIIPCTEKARTAIQAVKKWQL